MWNRLLELSDLFLGRKIQLCEELLIIADILEPGYSRFRGNLLYDLQAAMVVQANRKYDNQLITKQEFWVLLKMISYVYLLNVFSF